MVCVSSIRGLVFECQSRESEKFAGFLSVGSRDLFLLLRKMVGILGLQLGVYMGFIGGEDERR